MSKASGQLIWITGLSGSGKTTLARALLPHLAGAILLDGDELRAVLGVTNSAFDGESRQKLALSYARLAELLAAQGFTVLVATISLFHVVHQWNREHFSNYLEVFLDVPEAERRRRDPKGLYAAEQTAAVRQMAGAEIAVELPLAPHLTLTQAELPTAVAAVLRELPVSLITK